MLADYLADNYCPTIEEEHQEGCPGHLAQHYPDMLGAVVHRLVTIIETAMILSLIGVTKCLLINNVLLLLCSIRKI